MKIEKHSFGTLTIGDHFIIGEVNEDTDIQLDDVSKIIDVANKYFKGDKWGYISNRINSYSLQPLVHHDAPKFEKNMLAFAVVSNNKKIDNYTEVERIMVDDSYAFSSFSDLDEAIIWIRSFL